MTNSLYILIQIIYDCCNETYWGDMRYLRPFITLAYRLRPTHYWGVLLQPLHQSPTGLLFKKQ